MNPELNQIKDKAWAVFRARHPKQAYGSVYAFEHGFSAALKEVEKWKEQARMQGERADEELRLRIEATARANYLTKKIEELNQTGGTERQARYIGVLLAQLEKAGIKKSEFDQEAGK